MGNRNSESSIIFSKSGREVASLTFFGRMFQIFGAANAKERSPADFSFVFGILRRISQLERKERLFVCMTRRVFKITRSIYIHYFQSKTQLDHL